MKIFSIFIGLIILVSFTACKKSESTTASNTGADFKYISLVANDTIMHLTDVATITATATGDGLKYEWSSDFGSFVGSGSSVQWTVCHADRFRITCKVSDSNNHTESKDVYIRTME